MKFDKSRVFTAVNANELKPGDKVIVSDTMSMLTLLVRETTDSMELATLKKVHLDNEVARFETSTGNWCLAYLVERKENCTNCDCCVCAERNWATDLGNERIYCCPRYKPKTEKKPDCPTCKNREECDIVLGKNSDRTGCEEWEAEKHYRPFANTDELVKVWNAKIGMPRCLQTDGALTKPYIWVQRLDKSTGVSQHLITSLNVPILKNELWTNGVSVEGTSITLEALFRCYEFLDGSPCGVEVKE